MGNERLSETLGMLRITAQSTCVTNESLDHLGSSSVKHRLFSAPPPLCFTLSSTKVHVWTFKGSGAK